MTPRHRTATFAGGLILSLLVGPARGQDGPDASAPDETHPVYAADAGWTRDLLIGIAGLFAAAATIGPLVWWRSRDLVPSAATHEEDPSADRHG